MDPVPETNAETPPHSGEVESREAVREHLVRRFKAWLDAVLEQETGPPFGIAEEVLASLEADPNAAERGVDLYSLWEGMTALTQEVKLQGRSFKHLGETMEPLSAAAGSFEALLKKQDEVATEAARFNATGLAEAAQAGERRARREMLDLLLDLRDRLCRGRDGATSLLNTTFEGASPPAGGWLGRLLGYRAPSGEAARFADAVRALTEGYAMTLDRLDEDLHALGVQSIAAEGAAFDPASMQAVEAVFSADAPEGTVLAVHRAGYLLNGTVHRPARVKVSKGPANGAASS